MDRQLVESIKQRELQRLQPHCRSHSHSRCHLEPLDTLAVPVADQTGGADNDDPPGQGHPTQQLMPTGQHRPEQCDGLGGGRGHMLACDGLGGEGAHTGMWGGAH